MESPSIAGNPPSALPAALIAEGDSLESLRRIGKALPDLRAAADKFGPAIEQFASDRDCSLSRASILRIAGDAGLAYFDTLRKRGELEAEMMSAAKADFAERVSKVALDVAYLDEGSPPEVSEVVAEIRHARKGECAPFTPCAADDLWLSLYHTVQHYGGPEEGGWWYFRTEPIACVRVFAYSGGRAEAEADLRRIAADKGLIIAGDPDARPITSCSSRNRIDAEIIGGPFPFDRTSVNRPRYE